MFDLSNLPVVSIDVSGPDMSGKTLIASMIAELLTKHGVSVHLESQLSKIYERMKSDNVFDSMEINKLDNFSDMKQRVFISETRNNDYDLRSLTPYYLANIFRQAINTSSFNGTLTHDIMLSIIDSFGIENKAQLAIFINDEGLKNFKILNKHDYYPDQSGFIGYFEMIPVFSDDQFSNKFINAKLVVAQLKHKITRKRS